MKIGYFADGPWSHKALKMLLECEEIEIGFICVRFNDPDKFLIEVAKQKNIVLLRNQNINSDEFYLTLTRNYCDLFVSMSFNQIFKKRTYSIPKFGTINCHAGRLPFYRGRNVLNWALINDEKEFGVTVHYVDEGVDTGDIIAQYIYPISDDDNYSSLLDKAYDGCAETLFEVLSNFDKYKALRLSQKSIHPTGFYCSGRMDGDEIVDWNQGSRRIYNFVRAICLPGPRALTHINGCDVRINRVEMIKGAPNYLGVPGAVLEVSPNYLIVKTGDSFIKVSDWATESKIRVGDRFV